MPERVTVLAWMRLARVFQKVSHATANELRTWNLNTAQFDVLAQVGSAQEITQQELADRLLVTKGNISQLLERMERQGLLARCREGRAKYLSLTGAGQKLYTELIPVHEEMITQRFSALSKEEASQLLRLLRKLDHTLM